MKHKIILFIVGCFIVFVNCYAQSNSVNCSPNLNFSLGNFTNWECFLGKVNSTSTVSTITMTSSTPTIFRHTLIKKNANSAVDPYGLFPVTPANSSDYVLKLGNDSSKYQAERVRYKLNIPNNLSNFSITYQYAVVLEDPNHKTYQQPRLNVKWIDSATGNVLNCPSVEFVVSNLLPGFSPSNKYFIKTDTVWYKPWSKVYVNLTPYMGKTIYLEVTTADCSLGAHFGYGYFDVLSCGENIVVPTWRCTQPSSIQVTAPPGFQTYKWWDSTYSNLLATGLQTIISPSPPLNSSFNLEIIPYNGYGCRDTIKTKPIVIGKVLADAGTDKIICRGLDTTIGGIAKEHHSYSWLPNIAISNSNILNPVVSPISQQEYYLTAYDSTTFCSGFDTVKISQYPKPLYNFKVLDSVRCINTNFSFTSTINSLLKSFIWNFNDGTTSTLNNPTHTYSTFGNHQVTFLVSDTNNCRDSLTKLVTVSQNPAINFSVNAANQCLRGNLYTFSNTYFSTNGMLKFNWDFGDNSTHSTLANPQHQFNQVGNHTIKVFVTDSINCIDSVVTPVKIYQHPTAKFSVNDSSQCLNTNIYAFTNTSTAVIGGLKYQWNFGDGVGVSSVMNPTYQYASYGNKNVRLIVIDTNLCNDTAKLPVVIFPTPSVLFGIDTTHSCLTNNLFSFSNTSSVVIDTISNFIWNFGDGKGSNLLSPSHSYTSSGTYQVSLLAQTNNGCKDSTKKPLTVFAMPLVNITSKGINNICAGDSTTITANALAQSGNISQYQWFNNGALMLNKDSFIAVSQAGNYNVIVSNSYGCKSVSTSIPISIYPYPVGSVFPPISYNICEGSSIKLTATSGYNYQWYYNGDSIPLTNAPSFSATKDGQYTVKFFNQFGCATYASNNIKLKYIAKPKSIFAFDKYCINTFIDFKNNSVCTTGDSLSFQWTFGDGHSSKLFSPTHYFTQAKNYSVSLNVTSNICNQLQDISTQPISIVNPISSIRYPAVNALVNKPQPLTARDIGTKYSWRPHYYLNNYNTLNPVFNGNREEQYYISILMPNGCSVTDTLLVKMFEDGDIFVPKAFTPNKDGHNDKLYPLIVGTVQLKMFRIFNRWGQLMFETSTQRLGWDGIFNGVQQPMDTYTWTVEAISYDGKLIRRSGNSVLIR